MKHSLSQRERQVWNFIAAGYTNKEIACYLSRSHQTIRNITRNLYLKLGVRNRAQATAHFYQAYYHTGILHRILKAFKRREPRRQK